MGFQVTHRRRRRRRKRERRRRRERGEGREVRRKGAKAFPFWIDSHPTLAPLNSQIPGAVGTFLRTSFKGHFGTLHQNLPVLPDTQGSPANASTFDSIPKDLKSAGNSFFLGCSSLLRPSVACFRSACLVTCLWGELRGNVFQECFAVFWWR